MGRGGGQWGGTAAGRPRQAANGSLGGAGPRRRTFINERGRGGLWCVCIYTWLRPGGL